jgi:hypothetical protein
MKYIGSFSADMYDLKKPKEKKRLCLFAENFFHSIETHSPTAKNYMPLIRHDFEYRSDKIKTKIDLANKKVLIVTDVRDHQINLVRMIERFKASFSGDIETVNLCDLHIKGSCLGCLQCGYDNECVYKGKDDYIDF